MKSYFYNYTGLGIILGTLFVFSQYYPNNDYFLYTKSTTPNNRLNFLKERNNCHLRVPFSFQEIFLRITGELKIS